MGKFKDLKITEQELANHGMTSLSGTRWTNQAEMLKKKLDEDGTFVGTRLGQVLDLLESIEAALYIGASPLYYSDTSDPNIQAKLLKLKEMIDAINQSIAALVADPRVIPYGSITADKLAPNIAFDLGGWGDNGNPVENYNPYDFAVTGYGLDAMRQV